MSTRGLPLYCIVRDTLRREIAETMKPGDQLPTEPELMARMSVSRITVRYALEQLQNEGFIRREQGRGTFVAFPSVRPDLSGLTSFLDDISASGQTPSTKALHVGRMLAPPRICDCLGVSPTTSLMRVEKIRLANEEPISFETSFILLEIAARWNKRQIEQRPIFDLEKAQGVELSRGAVEITSAAASAEIAKHLRVRKGAPLLRVDRVVFDGTGRAIECDILLYRSDRVRYSFETQSDTGHRSNLAQRGGLRLIVGGAKS